MISALKEQLAIDLNAEKGDFEQGENVVTILSLSPLKRRNIDDELLLFMACFGKAAVAAVSPQLEPFMSSYIADMDGFRCFDMPLNILEQELKKHGAVISEIEEFYLPDRREIQPVNPDFEFEILEGEAVKNLYGDHRFHMALGYSQETARRDMLAVVAHEKGEILGVAGASNDTDDIWQIGIDVVPESQQHHVATDLVKIISNEVLKRNKIPYYGTAWSNIASKRVAMNAGYKPVWVEMKAMKG